MGRQAHTAPARGTRDRHNKRVVTRKVTSTKPPRTTSSQSRDTIVQTRPKVRHSKPAGLHQSSRDTILHQKPKTTAARPHGRQGSKTDHTPNREIDVRTRGDAQPNMKPMQRNTWRKTSTKLTQHCPSHSTLVKNMITRRRRTAGNRGRTFRLGSQPATRTTVGGHNVMTPRTGNTMCQRANSRCRSWRSGMPVVSSTFRKENYAPAGTSLSSGTVTTNGPAVLVAFWWGDGLGLRHTAVPDSGFEVIESFTDLPPNSGVQCVVAVREVEKAGSYSLRWATLPAQGAPLWLLAFAASGRGASSPRRKLNGASRLSQRCGRAQPILPESDAVQASIPHPRPLRPC